MGCIKRFIFAKTSRIVKTFLQETNYVFKKEGNIGSLPWFRPLANVSGIGYISLELQAWKQISVEVVLRKEELPWFVCFRCSFSAPVLTILVSLL